MSLVVLIFQASDADLCQWHPDSGKISSFKAAHEKMHCFLCHVALIFFISTTTAQTEVQHIPEMTVFTGSSIVISCHSSLAPTWQWSNSKNDANKILALSGIEAHPNLNDKRFQFTKKGSLYSVSMSEVRMADAGTYSCLGDAFVTTVLNVVR